MIFHNHMTVYSREQTLSFGITLVSEWISQLPSFGDFGVADVSAQLCGFGSLWQLLSVCGRRAWILWKGGSEFVFQLYLMVFLRVRCQRKKKR